MGYAGASQKSTINWDVAQPVECLTVNQVVGGSSPSVPANFRTKTNERKKEGVYVASDDRFSSNRFIAVVD